SFPLRSRADRLFATRARPGVHSDGPRGSGSGVRRGFVDPLPPEHCRDHAPGPPTMLLRQPHFCRLAPLLCSMSPCSKRRCPTNDGCNRSWIFLPPWQGASGPHPVRPSCRAEFRESPKLGRPGCCCPCLLDTPAAALPREVTPARDPPL